MLYVSCDKIFSRRDAMLRHSRNKHGTSQPYTQNHRAYPPPSPPSAPPPLPFHSPIQTYKPSWISIAATTTTTTAATTTTIATITTTTSEVENGFRFRHPFTANITGPTGCGKTYFVKTLLQNCRTKMAPPPQRIGWLHKRWQPLYDVIRKTVFPRVECRRGIPMDLDGDDFFDPRI